jgi:hypothetical protein
LWPAALLVAAAVLSTCSDRPEAPTRANPFDPDNPEGGDPFQLAARAQGGVVVLTWNDVPISGSAGYSIYRSRTADSLSTSPDTLETGLSATTFTDSLPIHDATSYYVVTVRSGNGEESLRSAAAGVRLDLPPALIVGVPGCPECVEAERRAVEVLVLAENADSVRLSNQRDSLGLIDPTTFVVTGAPIAWTLAPSDSADDLVKSVHGQIVRPGGSLSAIISDSIDVAPITLQMTVDGSSEALVTTGRRSVSLRFQRAAGDSAAPAGADSLEVSLDATFPGSWGPFSPTDSLLLADADLDTIFARVRNEFGIEARDSMAVRGDSLLDATIVLNNSASSSTPAVSTGLCRVNVHVRNGHATQLCLSNDPIPPCDPFEALTGIRGGWPIVPDTARNARVYVILANEWRPEGGAVLFDDILVRNDTLSVWIHAPSSAGNTYVIGAESTFVGIARSSTCGPPVQSCSLFVDSTLVGLASLESAAPSDSFDVTWRLPWTVAGPERATTVIARVTDADSVQTEAIFGILVLLESPAAPRARRWPG